MASYVIRSKSFRFIFWGYLEDNVYREPVLNSERFITHIDATVALVEENMII